MDAIRIVHVGRFEPSLGREPGYGPSSMVAARSGTVVRAHISALIVQEFAVDREQLAIAIDRGADTIVLLAGMIGRDQMLATILDPFPGRCSRSAPRQASTSSG